MRTSRTAAWLVVVVAGATVLGGCVYEPAHPAPGQPATLDGLTTEGFPPPGPPPVPGQITPAPVPPVAPANVPRPQFGPVPTEGPKTSDTTPRPTGAEAPPPGS